MKRFILLIFSIICVLSSAGQVLLNEASCRNFTQIADDTGDYPDWVELFNAGNAPVSLWHYHLSDDSLDLPKWALPDIVLDPGQWILIYASGRGKSDDGIHHWETAVREDQLWRWINPVENTSTSWMKTDFDDSGWNLDRGGFGYGDGDDRTQFPMDKISVYTRIYFDVRDVTKIVSAILHVDYDDGFVAYLNGVEIARANMSRVYWNSTADVSHEAIMFQGQTPEAFELDLSRFRTLLRNGRNLLAIEGHNFTAGLIDMSLRPFLSFGLTDEDTQFGPLPGWFFSGAGTGLHTNFRLSGAGESLFLTDSRGVLTDKLVLPPKMPVNSSIGCATDGSPERAVFLVSTPGSSNSDQVAYLEGFEAVPLFSHPGGFYQNEIEVSLTSTSPEARIRYTTDGKVPGEDSPLFAGGAIRIQKNTVLQARCFSAGHKLPSPVVASTYFIAQNPTPAGILSIAIDPADLYGETGIYDNWWTDWKKQCHIEYFEPGTHQPAFRQLAGIKIEGGAGGSRSLPQRSFRIEPGNGSLGDGDVRYPLIPARPDRLSYSTFYIRNGSNQHLFYPCKDAIETRCMGDSTKNTYAGYTPVQVYLNGQYWGYYELREKLDEDFFKQHEDTDRDSLEILSVSYWYGGTLRAVAGTDPVSRFNDDYSEFKSLNSLGPNFWELADRYIDLEYYTDYICAQSFMANNDWPYNNIRIHRSPQTGSRWRFSLVDLEWSLNPNGWSDSNTDHIRFMMDYDQSVPYVHIWQKAIQNQRFRNYFINRFADLMNSAWKKERLTSIANEIYQVTRPELPATYKRWGEPNIPVADYMTRFDQAHQTMLSELSNRAKNVRNHLKKNFSLRKTVLVTLNVEPPGSGTIEISTLNPEVYPWTGTYFDGIPVQIEARPNPGFEFTHWDANGLISDFLNAVFLDTLTRADLFKANFKAGNFSEKLVISEINYHSEPSVDAGDWIEIRNCDQLLTASLNGWYVTDEDSSHICTLPWDARIGPDGRIILVADPVKFQREHPGIPFAATFNFGLGASGDAVKLYNHRKELVWSVDYGDSAPWPRGADGQGRTLELKSELKPAGDPDNWFDGCIGGSPGQAYSPCNELVIISEINFKSASSLDHGDWVEWRNTGDIPADISGWLFKDGIDSTGHSFMVPGNTLLLPHEHIVLAQDTLRFRKFHSGLRNLAGPFGFGLSDKGEWIRAYDASGKLRLSVRYDESKPWPDLAGGLGYTLELVDSAGVMNDGNNWMTGCFGGSPGNYYTPDCSGTGMESTDDEQDIRVYPNPASDKIFIESGAREPVRIIMKNLTGATVFHTEAASGLIEVSVRNLPSGAYLLVVERGDGSRLTRQVVKL